MDLLLRKSTDVGIKRIRTEYNKLATSAQEILESIDVKDHRGKIVETGHQVVYQICEMKRAGKDVSENIKIVGEPKWLKLDIIWKRLRELEGEERKIALTAKKH